MHISDAAGLIAFSVQVQCMGPAVVHDAAFVASHTCTFVIQINRYR